MASPPGSAHATWHPLATAAVNLGVVLFVSLLGWSLSTHAGALEKQLDAHGVEQQRLNREITEVRLQLADSVRRQELDGLRMGLATINEQLARVATDVRHLQRASERGGR